MAQRSTWARLLAAPLLTAAIVAYLGSQTRIGAGLVELSYASTQSRLAQQRSSGPLRVSVVDISGLPLRSPSSIEPADCYRFRECITDRDSLLSLVRGVLDQAPMGIGIDIDFSPEDVWIDPQRDPWFLAQLLELREQSQTPIYVVAGRTAALGSGAWLGSRRFAALAAGATYSARDFRAPFTLWQASSLSEDRLCSMAALLTGRCRGSEPPGEAGILTQSRWHDGGGLDRFLRPVRPFGDCRGGGTSICGEEFFVDYSRLGQIRQETCVASEPRDLRNCRGLDGKVVLLGFAGHHAPIDDYITVPTESTASASVPGVVALAAATQTLLDRPIRVPSVAAVFVLDTLFAALVLIVAELVGWRLRSVDPRLRLRREYVNLVQQFAPALLFAVLGLVLVAWTGIIWGDFLLTIPVLLALLWIEPRVSPVAAWARKRLARAFVVREQTVEEPEG